jgi:hypothetical protein
MPYFQNRRGHILKQECNAGQIKMSITQGYRVEEILSNGNLMPLNFSNYTTEFKDETDRSMLQEMFDRFSIMNLDLYTVASSEPFKFYMTQSRKLLNQMLLTQWQVNDAAKKLEEAWSLLAEKADASELIELIQTINTDNLLSSCKADITRVIDKLNSCIDNGISETEISDGIVLINGIKEKMSEFIKGNLDELTTMINTLKEDVAAEKYSEHCLPRINEVIDAYDELGKYIEVPAVHVDGITGTAKNVISNLLTKATEETAIAKYDELQEYEGTSELVEEYTNIFKTVEESKYQEFITKVNNFIEEANSGDPTELQAVLTEISTLELGTTKNEKNLKNKVKEANTLLETNKYAQTALDQLTVELRSLMEKIESAKK